MRKFMLYQGYVSELSVRIFSIENAYAASRKKILVRKETEQDIVLWNKYANQIVQTDLQKGGKDA